MFFYKQIMNEEYFYDRSEYDEYDNNNSFYEEETFYVLTGGIYGDYDEWLENGGDFDSLMDSLGY